MVFHVRFGVFMADNDAFLGRYLEHKLSQMRWKLSSVQAGAGSFFWTGLSGLAPLSANVGQQEKKSGKDKSLLV